MSLIFDERKALGILKKRFANEGDCMAAFGITGRETPEELRRRFGSARNLASAMGLDAAIMQTEPRRRTMAPRLTYDEITSRNRSLTPLMARDQAMPPVSGRGASRSMYDQEEWREDGEPDDDIENVCRMLGAAADVLDRKFGRRAVDQEPGEPKDPALRPPSPGPSELRHGRPDEPPDDYGNDARFRRFMRASRDLCLPIMPSERSTDGDRRAK
jgi:hypothetical protein